MMTATAIATTATPKATATGQTAGARKSEYSRGTSNKDVRGVVAQADPVDATAPATHPVAAHRLIAPIATPIG